MNALAMNQRTDRLVKRFAVHPKSEREREKEMDRDGDRLDAKRRVTVCPKTNISFVHD